MVMCDVVLILATRGTGIGTESDQGVGGFDLFQWRGSQSSIGERMGGCVRERVSGREKGGSAKPCK